MLRFAGAWVFLIAWLWGAGMCARAAGLPQVKLTTGAPGIYAVPVEALTNVLGLTAPAVRERIQQGGFGLMHQGQAAGWFSTSDGGRLCFVAEARHNNYTDQNVYWLVEGTNAALTAADGGGPSSTAGGFYAGYTNFGQAIYCEYQLANHPDSNYWYWANVVASHPFRGSFSTAFALDDIAPTNATAWLTVRVCGGTTTNHALALTVNGVTNTAWMGVWSNLQPAEFTFAVPAGLLAQSSNNVRFTALGNFASQWWLAGWRLAYPHNYSARNGYLECSANSNAVITASGFSSPAITVLDVTQPAAPVLITNAAIISATGSWQVSFAALQPTARYAIWQSGAELSPASIDAVWPVGLISPTNRAANVLITPANLLAAAQPLADYRNRQGLETKVVSLDAIYDEFNFGFREPFAISNFLAYAGQQWQVKPAYALLLGNGTYDYRNKLGNGDDLVPPLMVPTLYGLAASDNLYGQVVPGNGPQIAVGRWPVTNAMQLAACIAKLKAYEGAMVTGQSAVLLADLTDPAAGDFSTDLQAVEATLDQAFATQMILPADLMSNTATLRTMLLSNLNAGTDLFCYLGHGASQMLGNVGYLSTADVPELTNGGRLPVVSAVTCLAGFYAQPGYDCLAEALVLAPQQGAIATFSCSGFSLDAEATELNLGLMSALTDGTPGRLGDFVRRAMGGYNQTPHFTPSAIYNLLGDPALLFHGATAPPPVAPQISGLSRNEDGSFALSCAAQPGQNYVLSATTNLALPLPAWPVVSTGVVPFGSFGVVDWTATNCPQRFYQLRTQAP